MGQPSRHLVYDVYSEVLFDLAEEAGLTETVYDDLQAAGKVFQAEPEFLSLLTLGKISDAEKEQLLRRVFEGRICSLALDFLIVLARRNRLPYLFGIQDYYQTLLDQRRHIQKVEVTLAKQPTPEQQQQLEQRIADALKAHIKLDIKVDPEILGGIIIKKGDMQIDHSVRSLLDRSVEALMGALKRTQEQHDKTQHAIG